MRPSAGKKKCDRSVHNKIKKKGKWRKPERSQENIMNVQPPLSPISYSSFSFLSPNSRIRDFYFVCRELEKKEKKKIK